MPPCPHAADDREPLFRARDWVTSDEFTVCACRRCGLRTTEPQPSGESLARYYPAAYYGTASARRFPRAVEAGQRLLYALRARRVEALAGRPGRVLDVGCGRGSLLDAFRLRGWDACGTELSDGAAEHARSVLGLRVVTSAPAEWPWPPGHFDAVTAWHVAEHWPDPRALVDLAWRLLRPGGVLLVGVPDSDGLEARLARDKWFHLDVPRHLVHPGRRWILRELDDAGFDVRSTSSFAPEYDCFSFVQSALNRIGVEQNLAYDCLRGRAARLARLRGARRAVHAAATLLLSAPLVALSLPVTVVAGLAGRGSSISAYAVKRAQPRGA